MLQSDRKSQSTKYLAGLLMLVLTACSLPKPQDRGLPTSAATYSIEKAEISVTTQTTHPNFSIPLAKTYNFRVCLRDNKLQKAIIGHEFKVETSDQTKTLTSDSNGCVIWLENIAYNHLADARFVEIQRSLSANGFHKGNRQVMFAINPWEDLGYSLLDKEIKGLVQGKEQSERTLKGLSDSGQLKKKAVWFDDLRLTIDEKRINNQGIVLNFEIRAQPSISVVKSSGQKAIEFLTKGEFEGELSLIHVVSENQKEVRRLLEKPVQFGKKAISNNFLMFEVPVQLSRICTRGQIQLGLKIKPLNAPETLTGFEGAFIIGECDQLKGSFFARLKNVFEDNMGSISIDQYLTEAPGPTAVSGATTSGPRNSQDPKLSADTTQADYYQQGQIEIKKLRFETVAFPNSSPIYRTKQFNVTACMKTGLDQKGMRGQTFQIKKINGQADAVRSNDDGCISWDDSLDYNFLARECWLQKELQITNANLGVNQTLKINVNPWTGGDAAFRDIRFLNAQGQQLFCSEGKSEIILTGFSFDKKEITYAIDSFLSLRMKKTGLLKLTPILKRPSLTEPSGFDQGFLPVGAYVLRFAVVDNSVKDFKKAAEMIYQISEQLVFIHGAGTIAENLTLESSNVKAIGNTNQILFEILPAKADAAKLLKDTPSMKISDLVDTDALVAHQTYSAPLILANNSEGSTASKVFEGDSSLIESLKLQLDQDTLKLTERNRQLTQKETLAKNENLVLFNISQEDQTTGLRKSLESPTWWYADNQHHKQKALVPIESWKLKQPLMEGHLNEELAQRLCAYWFYDQMRRPVKSIHVAQDMRTGKPGEIPISSLVDYLPKSFQLTSMCRSDVQKDPSKWFDVQFRYLLKNVQKIQDLPLQVRDLSIQTSFSASRGHADTQSTSFSWDASAGLTFGTKFFDLLGVSTATGVRYQKSKTATESEAFGTAASFQSGIYSTVERLSFKLRSEGVEKCMVIKLNPRLYQGPKTLVGGQLDSRLSIEEMASELTKGLLICQGEARIKQLDFVETYFVINQKPTMTQITDPNSDHSRLFFTMIRGQRDFNAFVGFLQGALGTPDSATGEYQAKQVSNDKLTHAFLEGVRAYPGHYQSLQ